MTKKRIGIWLLVAVLFGGLLYATVYLLASHGEAFKLVEQTIMGSQVLQAKVGRIERLQLAPFGAYDERTAGDSGSATMTVEVMGTTRTIALDVKVKKTNGEWEIEQVSLDGKPLVLN